MKWPIPAEPAVWETYLGQLNRLMQCTSKDFSERLSLRKKLSFPMNDKTLLRVGVIGGVITALCCFTPVLVVLLGAVGLSAWVGWLDYVLLPALLIFVGITAYALFKREKA